MQGVYAQKTVLRDVFTYGVESRRAQDFISNTSVGKAFILIVMRLSERG